MPRSIKFYHFNERLVFAAICPFYVFVTQDSAVARVYSILAQVFRVPLGRARALNTGAAMRFACGVSVLMAVMAQAMSGEALRIVPQRMWPEKGVVSPDRKLWAAVSPKRVFLIDAKDGALISSQALEGARSVAFSNDGAYLGVCGDSGGLLIDLRDASVTENEALRGGLLVFGADSKTIILMRSTARVENDPASQEFKSAFGRVGAQQEVALLDLSFKQINVFPSKVPHPLRLMLSPGGETLSISGFHGDPMMHVPRLGRADELMDLKSGKSTLTIDPPDRNGRADFIERSDPLPKVDAKKRTAHTVQSFFWDDSSGQCVLYGAGMPEGGVVKAWDIRNALLSRHLGKQNSFLPYGFQGSGQLFGSTWSDDANFLVSVNLQTGKMNRRGKYAEKPQPSPDGKHVAVLIPYSGADTSGEGVEIRDETGAVVMAEKLVSRIAPGYWSPQGRYYLRIAEDRRAVHLFDLRERSQKRLKLTDFFTPPENMKADTHLWSFAVDPEETRMALGVGGANSGAAVVLDIARGEVLSLTDGQASWVNALRFISKDELMVASRHGTVMLHDVAAKKNRWTQKTGEVCQFGYVKGGEFLVCQDLYGAARFLQLSDGALVRSTKAQTSYGSSDGTPWTHPALMGDGTHALEVDFDQFSIRLVHARSGATLLTYVALPEDQWIVYAPNGMWKGSDRVEEYVRFYQGMRRLDKAEALRWSDPEGVKNIARILN